MTDPQPELVGWTVAEAVFSPEECDDIVAACEGRSWPLVSGGLERWITDARWTAQATAHLGPRTRFLREQLVTKPCRADVRVPWHQDQAYADLDRDFLTCFLALEDITVDNGCLWMLPGSHWRGPVEHVAAGYLLEVAEPITEQGVPVPLAKGSLVAFSSLLIHRSGGNTGDGLRRAWMVQFAPS